MRECPTCKASLADNARACPKCGHSFIGAVERTARTGCSVYIVLCMIIVVLLVFLKACAG